MCKYQLVLLIWEILIKVWVNVDIVPTSEFRNISKQVNLEIHFNELPQVGNHERNKGKDPWQIDDFPVALSNLYSG